MKIVHILRVIFVLFFYFKIGKPRIVTQAECGRLIEENAIPWTVGIYEENVKSKNFNLICLGTIIFEDAVITAAQCVTDQGSGRLKKNGLFVSYDTKLEKSIPKNSNSFLYPVDKNGIFIHNNFQGILKNAIADLALLRLNQKLKAMPACVDWSDLDSYLNERDTGLASIWQDTIARLSHLSYIDFDRCFYSVSEDFAARITSDKLCMKCNGPCFKSESIGAGVTVQNPDNGLWYLKGVLSSTTDKLGIFTALKPHLNWISNTCAKM